MAYTYSFFDGQTAGAEDLNKWVSLFVTDGVADQFENGVPYSLCKLNDIVKNNCSEGIVPDGNSSLQVTVAGDYAVIEPGIAFFADGSVIEITAKESLALTKGKQCYVYLKSSAEENRAYPALSGSLPTGNVVPLAKIGTAGEVEDLRRYAKGRVPSFYASDVGLNGIGEFTIDKPGDYILTRGPHTYSHLMLKGYVKTHQDGDYPDTLAYCTANLASREVESHAVRVRKFMRGEPVTSKDVSWNKSTNGIAVLFDMYVQGILQRVEGEFVQEGDTLLLRVRFTGKDAEDKYAARGYSIPMHCQVLFI